MRIQILGEGGGIGDMMMRFGVIRSIKQKFPDAEIWLVTDESLVEWAALDRAVTQRVTITSSGRRPIGALPDPQKYDYLEEGTPFDATIDMYGPETVYEDSANGPLKKGRAAVWRGVAEAVLDCKLEPQVGKLAMSPAENELAVAKLIMLLNGRPHFLVGLHPQAHWDWRSLSLEQLEDVIAGLQEQGATCLIFHHKRGKVTDIAERMAAIPVIGEKPATILRMVKLCDAIVAVDSGFFHIGGTTGVPTLGLFAQTDGELTGGEYESCRWITAGEEEREGLLCNYPCYRRREAGCVHPMCKLGCRALRRIPAATIVSETMKLITDRQGMHLPPTERQRRPLYKQELTDG